MNEVYVFGNGIRVHRADLVQVQLARYALSGNPNLHEPAEEKWILQVLASCRTKRPVFLDIGAGIGYYSILTKKRYPGATVIASEPLPRHLEAGRKNLILNGLPADAVTFAAAAVAPERGRARLVDHDFGSFISPSGAEGFEVETKTLADFVVLAGGSVDVAKMDIQNHELSVLRASEECLSRNLIKFVVVGTHTPASHAGVRACLERYGQIICDDPAPPFQPDGLIVADLRRRRKAGQKGH